MRFPTPRRLRVNYYIPGANVTVVSLKHHCLWRLGVYAMGIGAQFCGLGFHLHRLIIGFIGTGAPRMTDNETDPTDDLGVTVETKDPEKATLQNHLESSGRNYGVIGLIGTILYLGLVWWILDFNNVDIGSMAPNAWGDFLAGIFGPLALFWVVMGFWQQGSELRNSRNALLLQAKELQQSVEAQRELVKVNISQVELEKEKIEKERRDEIERIRPKLRLLGLGQSATRYMFRLENVGADCIDIEIRRFDEETTSNVIFVPRQTITKGGSIDFNMVFSAPPKNGEQWLDAYYFDSMMNRHERHFKLLFKDGGMTVGQSRGTEEFGR